MYKNLYVMVNDVKLEITLLVDIIEYLRESPNIIKNNKYHLFHKNVIYANY